MTWDLNLGSLLIVASVIFSAGGFYYASRGDQRRMKEDIDDIKLDLKALNKVVMDVALQNARIDNLAQAATQREKRNDERFLALERRWEELRRGDGIITKVRGAVES
jgi:hypothetical protein